MMGFRDTRHSGAHVVQLEVPIAFGADGVRWEPTTAEAAAMGATALRRARFVAVARPAPLPEPAPDPLPAEEPHDG